MGFFRELREVSISVLPIALIAVVLGLAFGIFSPALPLMQFIFSILLVIVGLSFFLMGVSLGFVPVGNQIGSLVTKKKNIALLLSTGVALGMIITIAEPDVAVLTGQVIQINPMINKMGLILVIAAGVGVFMAISYLRTLLQLSLKLCMLIGVGLLFLVASFVPEFFVSVAFDAGGATTGPMAVPFIMALGLGVAQTLGKKEEDSFGYTGLASIGPVLFVLLLGAFSSGSFDAVATEAKTLSLSSMFIHVLEEVTLALAPIAVICVLIQIFVMKLPRIKASRMYFGIFYTWFGIVLFLFAVKSSFMPVASALGNAVASTGSDALLIAIGAIFGAAVVLAEPAVWVLTEQVEEISQGRIRRVVMLLFISVGVALAVAMFMIRIIGGLSIWPFLIAGYALIALMMPLCPTLFVAIGFDSGGVATGPMSSTFLLPFAIGAASVLSGDIANASFGMIGLIAMMPVVTIELLGVIYNITIKSANKAKESA